MANPVPTQTASLTHRKTIADKTSQKDALSALALSYTSVAVGNSRIIRADCFEWLGQIPANSLHAIVTDPPYGVKEYNFDQIKKRANRNGGVWRIPPSFDGHIRSPLPRFTAFTPSELKSVRRFLLSGHESPSMP
jgi:site-specific DNA-methyltransferase (adenine-specific)